MPEGPMHRPSNGHWYLLDGPTDHFIVVSMSFLCDYKTNRFLSFTFPTLPRSALSTESSATQRSNPDDWQSAAHPLYSQGDNARISRYLVVGMLADARS
ncbi:unnamed protein product [Protopolystoma xenopodis]|uniref:Uncharacterized protein n=1 Tax=Protopolystoma xenopodis TaxID=117903 RepID=A0A3S5CJD1_9PLAT|nr:unnamed protein product [Protopolystoma xenopodis]